MTRKLVKWLSLGLGSALVLALAAAVMFYWRLQQGPLRVPFLEPYVNAALNDTLRDAGLKVRFQDVVVEIDRARGLPTLRMRHLTLHDERSDNAELASAPRAAIALSGSDLLKGRLRVRHLELVGARVAIRRDAAGRFSVGLMRAADGGTGPASAPAGKSAKKAPSPPASGGARLTVGNVIAQLRETLAPERKAAALGALESLSITSAHIEYHDEVLNLSWRAPEAHLQVRRVPYGFALLAKARVKGLGRDLPVTVNAVWRRQSGQMSLSVQMHDAELASLLRGLWGRELQTGGIHQPFSARLGMELDATGTIASASAEVLLDAGRVELPAWLASPIVVREGLLRLDYRPQTGEISISQGSVRLASGQVSLAGSMRLIPPAQKGALPLLGLNVRLGHAGAGGKERSLLERISLKGLLHLHPLRLDMDDLQIHGDGGAMRLRGTVRREREGAGVYVSGRARNISHRMLKALWPPKVGIGARLWLRENVSAGVIGSATVRLAIPGKVLKAAVEDDIPMPDKVADVTFTVSGVRFSYVEGWPEVVNAAGSGRMTGNHFFLRLKQGHSRLPSGKVVKLASGELRARDLAAKVSPGSIEVRASGPAQGFEELISLPPLRLRQRLGITKGKVHGQVELFTRLLLPFQRGMTGDDIEVARVTARIVRADVIGMVEAFDLRNGRFQVEYEKGLLRARGNARLNNDLPVQLLWQRYIDERKAKQKPLLRLTTRLTDAQRRKMGFDLSPWITGPLRVELQAPGDSWRIRRFGVRLGLDEMAMKLPAIGWSRPPRKGTRATFDVLLNDDGSLRIQKLRLAGPGGLRIEGKLRLHANGRLRDATFARFELDENNRLALGLELEKNRLNVVAAGPVFDARPLIRRLFAPRREIDRTLHSVFVRVNLRKVLALRGEAIENVRGEVEIRNGLVRRATLTGRFASGRPVALDLVPARDGLRRLRIVTDDAGALLRASGLYSRVVGGEAEFTALLKSGEDGGVQRGLLIMRRFMVRGDQRLARLRKGGRGRTGPRRGQRFKKLVLPFSTDKYFIRIGDAIVRSPEIGATANGIIRRTDGAMDIGGVIIPAYAVNAALGKIPVLGAILTGGKGQGVFGMTYALKGSMSKPKFLVNPLSAVAPGVFRQLFHLGGQNVNPDGTPRRRNNERRAPRSRTNLANGG